MRLANRRARALVLADKVAAVAALAVPLLIFVPHPAVAGDQSAAKAFEGRKRRDYSGDPWGPQCGAATTLGQGR
jgi:hypothetical protein